MSLLISHDRLNAFIHALPKTETHLHLEGALPFHFVQEAYPDRYDKLPASWAPDFKFKDFRHFEVELLEMVSTWYSSPERYYEAASEIFGRLYHEQYVRYMECSFASGIVEYMGGDIQANAEAIKSAAPKGFELKLFMGMHHAGYNEKTYRWVDDTLNCPFIDGIDLHGPENDPIPENLPDLWARYRASGRRTKAHAGEFCGPGFVRQVLKQFDTRRIQHGVRSVEDPDLPAYLAELGVVLDICPISNVKLNVVPSIARHPLRQLIDAGITCTISTDDPISFGNFLDDEYRALALELDFTFEELAQLARNGFVTSDLSQAEKAHWLSAIDKTLADHG